MSNNRSLLRLFFAAMFLTLFLGACYSPTNRSASQQNESGTSISDEDMELLQKTKRASVAGKLNLPEDGDGLGIVIFAEGTSFMAFSDARGEFEISGLPIGQYNLYAMRHDLETLMVADIVVTAENIEADQPFMTLDALEMNQNQQFMMSATMGNTNSIVGQIQGARPQDALGVRVEIFGTQYRTTTDSQGNFTLLNVPAGDYILDISRDQYLPTQQAVTVTDTGVADIGIVGISPRNPSTLGGRSIVGRVQFLDLDGNPVASVPDAYVSISGSGERIYLEQNGRFSFKNLEPQQYVVTASAPKYLLQNTATANLANTEIAELNLIMNEDPAQADLSSLVIGQVLLEDAETANFAGISVVVPGTDISTSTDAVGTYEMNLTEGTYSLVISMSGYKTAYIEDIRVPSRDFVELDPITLIKDVDYPEVVATSPSDGDGDVTITEPTIVRISFDQDMDMNSLRGAISVKPTVGYKISTRGQHPQADDRSIVIELAGYSNSGNGVLKFDTRYNVTVDTTAQSVKGVAMQEDFELNFRTGKAKVTGTFPSDGAQGVFLNQVNPARVFFNTGLDTEGFDAGDIRIRPALPSSANVYVVNDNQTGWGVLTIGGSFDFNEEYEITITNSLRTLTKDRISNLPYTFKFTTTTVREGGLTEDDIRTRREREENRK